MPRKTITKEELFEIISELYTNICYASFYVSDIFDEINIIFDTELSERDLLKDYSKYIDKIIGENNAK